MYKVQQLQVCQRSKVAAIGNAVKPVILGSFSQNCDKSPFCPWNMSLIFIMHIAIGCGRTYTYDDSWGIAHLSPVSNGWNHFVACHFHSYLMWFVIQYPSYYVHFCVTNWNLPEISSLSYAYMHRIVLSKGSIYHVQNYVLSIFLLPHCKRFVTGFVQVKKRVMPQICFKKASTILVLTLQCMSPFLEQRSNIAYKERYMCVSRLYIPTIHAFQDICVNKLQSSCSRFPFPVLHG